MLKVLPAFIGLRYVLSKREEGYISFVSLFSIGAMTLGVMALIIVLSVMNGFDREIKSRLLRVIPHLTVVPANQINPAEYQSFAQKIAEQDNIEFVLPLIGSYVMLSHETKNIGAELIGMDPNNLRFNELREDFISGGLYQVRAGEFGVIVGGQVARKIGITAGDQIRLTLPSLMVSPMGIFPRSKLVRVVGIFQVGAQIDGTAVFMHQKDVQKLLAMSNQYQGLQIFVADPELIDIHHKSLESLFPKNTQWRSWKQSMGSLFRAMQMEKRVVSLLLSVIIGVAAFNIIASLVLIVSEKRSDIAVLRTLGASSATIVKIFIVYGLIVGCVGILIGAVLGCVVAANIGELLSILEQLLGVHLFDPSIYLITVLPSKILVSDIISVCLAAVLTCFLATLYPAWQAGQILPAEVLSHEF